MAVIAQATGDDAEARRLLEESIALQREIGDRWSLSWVLNALSRLALKQLDLVAAERCAVEAMMITVEADYTTNALDILTTLAEVRVQQGLHTAALEMALHILRHPASTQDAKDRAEKLRAALEFQLTPQQLEAVQAQVEAQSFAAIVKEILGTAIT